ncbi:MAG TPA: hypothetical protein VKU94_04180 [Geobacterales bacterium]|nr:hypothetical protein [Geobacterales bacterium]
METYRIFYSNIYDLILYAISLFPISPFYTLNRYKDYIYFYESISDGVALHYSKTNLEPAIYIFDTTKLELRKQSSMPKFIEQGCYILVIKKIDEDTLFLEALEES